MFHVQAALAADGPLASAWPGWSARAAQQRMAAEVVQVLHTGGVLLAQLPTGSGKTLAYLVPALLWGGRTVVATSTHVLQHQLAADLRRTAEALGRPAQSAVLKGRSRYVCLQQLHAAVQQGPRAGALARHARLRELLAWAQASREGDLDELPGVADDAAVRAALTSTSESCLREACAHWTECHVERARRRAAEADVVVINHHLWLAQWRARREGRSAGVPEAGLLVFDEAHALHPLASEGLALRAEAQALARFWADLADLAGGAARGTAPWRGLAQQGERATRALAAALHAAAPREGLQVWPLPDASMARALGRTLEQAHRALCAAEGSAARLHALRARAVAFAQALQAVLRPEVGETAWLQWHDAHQWSVLRPGPAADEGDVRALVTGAWQGVHAVVHTSATLGDEPSLAWHRDALGLTGLASLQTLLQTDRLPPSGAAWHVPDDLPEPGDPAHHAALVRRIARWAQRLGGPVLVLATTRRAAARLATGLLAELPSPWRVLRVAGEGGARRAWLALRDRDARAPSVVVAAGSFWRGVDVPCNTLRLVVVDKLPFAPPDDPWVQRRLDRARASGLDGFETVQLVDAAMALRQAAGRLIRGPLDEGLFVVADVRLRSRRYAPRLSAAFEGWRWLESDREVEDWLDAQALTRASTTARPGA